MNQQKPRSAFSNYPLFIVFTLFNLLIIFGVPAFDRFGLQANDVILHTANIFWLLLTLMTLFMQKKALQNNNPNVFVRAVMGGMLLKMMAGALAVLVYYMVSGATFNQNSVIFFLLLYVCYLAVEVRIVMKLNQQTHA